MFFSFLRIYATGFFAAAVNWFHLPCLKSYESKSPCSKVHPPQITNWHSSHLSLLGINSVMMIIGSCIHRSQCRSSLTDANFDASLNYLNYAAELGQCFTGHWQGLVGHPGPPECSQWKSITPHVHIFPF